MNGLLSVLMVRCRLYRLMVEGHVLGNGWGGCGGGVGSLVNVVIICRVRLR